VKLDDEVCLCFHVTRRKVEQYIRVKRPGVASQLSDCFGAGTGCGWCRPFLERIFEAESRDQQKTETTDLPDAAEYANSRAAYRAKRKAIDDQA